MRNIAKKEILQAYIAGRITKQELIKYSEMHFPAAIMRTLEGEIKSQDKEIIAICQKIKFDLIHIVFEDSTP